MSEAADERIAELERALSEVLGRERKLQAAFVEADKAMSEGALSKRFAGHIMALLRRKVGGGCFVCGGIGGAHARLCECAAVMRTWPEPRARVLSMYVCSLIDRATPRTTREFWMPKATPSTTVMFSTLGPSKLTKEERIELERGELQRAVAAQ